MGVLASALGYIATRNRQGGDVFIYDKEPLAFDSLNRVTSLLFKYYGRRSIGIASYGLNFIGLDRFFRTS